jgi:type II secretory pathway pseudopilin PulG
MRLTRRAHAGLTLVEIVLSLGIMVILVAGFGAMASTSITTARQAKPALVAQAAAVRLAERMRSRAVNDATDWYWDNAAITKSTVGGVIFATGGGGIQEILAGTGGAEGLQQYYDQRLMGTPVDGFPPLRLRFLNEAEYKALWGFANDSDVDLNFDTALSGGEVSTAGWPAAPAYRMFPILIQVHWSEGQAARRHELKTILVSQDPVFGSP